ncbi:hypothetical protein V3331_10750 [Gaopeijia maritima]|uniref:hypothetical protein n=1 Tax=Gaopeijia maritima TaxID=3119007 RepID=UPI00324DB7DB
MPTFLIRADARLEVRAEGALPNQPGLRVITTMEGLETNEFIVAQANGRMLLRTRSAELSGRMEYIGMPQAVVLDVSRSYENEIRLVEGGD